MKRKIAEFINIIFGFRKFLLMLFVMAVAVIFRCKDLINGTEMVDLVKTTAIGFFSANGVEHIVGAINAYTGSKAPAQAPVEDLADTDDSNDEEDVK